MPQNPKITGRYQRITAAGEYELGDASDGAGIVSSHRVTLIPVNGLTGGNVTVKARPRGTEAETNSENAGIPVPYIATALNGAASDEAVHSAAITPLTGASIIKIPSSGLVPILSIAAISVGAWDVYVDRILGAD